MFTAIEDETGIANLFVWLKTFEKYRRVVLGAGIIGVHGRIRRAGEVVHLVAHRLADLSAELASVGVAFPLPYGRGDEFHPGSPVPDPRGSPISGRHDHAYCQL
jgi:error-prone DNA polymerase